MSYGELVWKTMVWYELGKHGTGMYKYGYGMVMQWHTRMVLCMRSMVCSHDMLVLVIKGMVWYGKVLIRNMYGHIVALLSDCNSYNITTSSPVSTAFR